MAHHKTASASASSSSAAYSASTDFHVFINHRGPDVKNTFAGHLYRSLSSHGLRVFLDQQELEAGHEISSQITAAIRDASVHIAVFSKRYAQSKWCLDELCLMVDSQKSGANILPVFYRVKPEDLRQTGTDKDGPYAKALRRHEEKQRYEPQKIRSWREALSHVADISGFELEACNGNEAELLDKVVQRVLTKAPKPALHVAKHATGLREKFEDFEKTILFQQEQQPVEAKVVGIAGVGGIGKTTLANEFFNCNRSQYGGYSFLTDVRENAFRSLLPSLQSQLIKDLKGMNKEVGRWEEGIGILKTCLSFCHALIILDDVDDADQLDAFLPIKGILDPKSLILVTSRDKHVLRSAGIPKASIYHLNGLSKPQSQELFCSYAFFQPYPKQGFEDLVVSFVNGCDGLPLSLKVFGALLCEQDKSYWEEKLKELQKLPRKILASLKISYDSLDQEEKEIFLDIACFAIGEEMDKWVRIWGGLTGLQTLEDRCLVEIVEVRSEKKMRMHDHLRDMGREIAEEISMPRRIWRSIKDVHDLFEEHSSSSNKQVIPKVRGIRMHSRRTFGITEEEGLLHSKSEIPLHKIPSQQEFRMRNLQLLESEGEFVEGILSRVRSPTLQWLCWNNCPCSALPSWIPMGHLKVLEVNGKELKKLWRCDSEAPLQLRELHVDAPLLEFPESIGKLNYLEKIVLMSFQVPGKLPEEIFQVRSLKYLNLPWCFSILPNELGNLTNLQHIKLSNCRRLKKLPDSLTELTNLRYINLDSCYRLKRLPNSLGNLTNIQSIYLSGCRSLKKLPNSLGDLTNLQRIQLNWCESLEVLPDSFGNLTNLQSIYLYGCKSLKKLPNSLGDLTNLQRIQLDGGESLEVLPDSFGNLTNLQSIYLSGCNNLKKLPNSLGDLTNLQRIQLDGCGSLEVLPDSFGNLTNLHDIGLSGCKTLKKLSNSFTDLKNLRQFWLSGCDRVKRLPKSLGNLTNLQDIHLSPCRSLKKLPNSLGDLTNLQRIQLNWCESLEVLPDSIGNLTNLQDIGLSDCKRLKKLPNSFTDLKNLRDLNLSGCDRVKRLPKSLGNLTNLQDIHLSLCRGLKKLPNSLGDLTNLQRISVTGCESLEVLPDSFGNLTNLQDIHLSGCKRLKKLPNSFTGLKNLHRLWLSGCDRVKRLPKSLGDLTNLRSIDLSGCKSLKKFPKSLGELSNLRSIDLSGCNSLKKFPSSFGNLLQLKYLDLSQCCMSLTTTLGNITTLEWLGFSGCVQMEVLPAQVEHQKSLKMLNLLGTNLKELTNAHTVGLSNLTYLCIGGPLLKELPPSLGLLSSLELLLLHGCQELKRLPDSIGLLTQLITLEISKCGIHELPGLMEMNNLETLRVRSCPLRELPFKEESGLGRKRKRRAKNQGLLGLKELELYCTEISEVSFPEGVCINLRTLSIKCCNGLVKVGSLPTRIGHLILRGCGALREIEGLFGLAELVEVDMRGCYNIKVEELPHFGNITRLFTTADTYNSEEEEVVEKELAALQEGVLPSRFL